MKEIIVFYLHLNINKEDLPKKRDISKIKWLNYLSSVTKSRIEYDKKYTIP